MQKSRTFGRRTSQATPMPRPKPPAPLPRLEPAAPQHAALFPPEPDGTFEVEEPQDVAEKSRRRFPFPWRPLSLIAGLSFGIGSFALPDSINDIAQWPLGVLALVSFYVGLRKPKEAQNPPKPQPAEPPTEPLSA